MEDKNTLSTSVSEEVGIDMGMYDELICLECIHMVPCKDRQCTFYMCGITGYCLHGAIKSDKCPLKENHENTEIIS